MKRPVFNGKACRYVLLVGLSLPFPFTSAVLPVLQLQYPAENCLSLLPVVLTNDAHT
jgi:hypothetical protein